MNDIVTGNKVISNPRIKKLTNKSLSEVSNFLANRPLQTFGLTSFISRNGLESPENKGDFYGFLNQKRQIEGIALLGHFSIFETDSLDVLKEIAVFSEKQNNLHLILGEKDKISAFWKFRAPQKKILHKDIEYVLLINGRSLQKKDFSSAMRPASPQDLENIVYAHAEVTLEDRGYNPLEIDVEEFRHRCLKRINNQQTWIAVENDEIVFKAEMMCQTSDIAYLEAIWVPRSLRGKGYGSRFINDLCHVLLKSSKTICLLVDANNLKSVSFYKKAGFEFFEDYTASIIHPLILV